MKTFKGKKDYIPLERQRKSYSEASKVKEKKKKITTPG